MSKQKWIKNQLVTYYHPQGLDQADGPKEQARRSPDVRVHYQTPTVAVVVPGLQAIVTGILTAPLVGFAVYWVGGGPWQVLQAAGFSFFAISFAAWVFQLINWRALVDGLEAVFQVDFSGDGIIGPAGHEAWQPETIRVEVSKDNGRSVQILGLPVSADRLGKMCLDLQAGKPFSESAWTGRAGLFSRSEFAAIRDEFLKRQIIRWKNPEAPSQGVVITTSGWAVIRSIGYEYADPPTLEG